MSFGTRNRDENVRPFVVDPHLVIASLARRRPVFHSEADFQFAFAWEAKMLVPGIEVRLETHPEPGVRLDLELIDPAARRGLAVELKYMTRLWAGESGGESFALKNHGASDLRAYDVVKDIERVERFVLRRPGWTGLVIALTNESAYWRSPTHGRATNADAFRLFEGNLLAGERRWGAEHRRDCQGTRGTASTARYLRTPLGRLLPIGRRPRRILSSTCRTDRRGAMTDDATGACLSGSVLNTPTRQPFFQTCEPRPTDDHS